MTRILCATCQQGPRESNGAQLLFKDSGEFFCANHLSRTSIRYEQALRQTNLDHDIAARLRVGGKAAKPPAARDVSDLEGYLAAVTANPAPADTSAKAAFEETPIWHKYGSGEKRRYYAAWPTADGSWRAARDVWVEGPDKRKTQSIQVVGPFPDRRAAINAAYALE